MIWPKKISEYGCAFLKDVLSAVNSLGISSFSIQYHTSLDAFKRGVKIYLPYNLDWLVEAAVSKHWEWGVSKTRW